MKCPTCPGAEEHKCCCGCTPGSSVFGHRCLVDVPPEQEPAPDRFEAEIHENYTEHLFCKNCDHERAQDI